MQTFVLTEPSSLNNATKLLASDPDARPLAGGTALVILLKHRLIAPSILVSLDKIKGLTGIREGPDGLWIGALTPIQDVAAAQAVRKHYPILAMACRLVANVRIRNVATLGGNVAHADPSSDPPTALAALGASVECVGPHGPREIPIQEFLIGSYETALEPGELIRGIRLPSPISDARGRYLKFTDRQSEDRPSCTVGAMYRQKGGKCEELRLVVGAICPVPTRMVEIEATAVGQRLDPELIDELAARAGRGVPGITDPSGPAANVVRVLVRRILDDCVAQENA